MFYQVELEEGKEETPHCVRGDSGDGGDSSQIRLGVTLFGKGGTPFPTIPQSLKVSLGGVRGGSVHLLDLRRRPLAKSARGDRGMVFAFSLF